MPNPLIHPDDAETHDFDWGQINWLASGGRGNAQQMTFGRVIIKAGCSNPMHWHPECEEILYLLSGKLAHDIGDKTYEMFPGDSIVIPPDTEHCARSIGDEDAVMLVVYPTPQREVRNE